MAVRGSRKAPGVLLRKNEPLIGLFIEEDAHEAVRYFSSEEAADQAVRDNATQQALDLAGAWKDLDWDSMAHELDRIRHESPASAPISL